MVDLGPAAARRVVVATHGHCFDGAACAAVFTRMLTAIEHPHLAFSYKACTYGPGPVVVDESVLDGDINALLDFRYTTCPRLDWYFDHHKTAFASAEEFQHFRGDTTGRRFHDPSCGSCTRLVADVARDRFGFHDPSLADLVNWAETIDAARFDSAEQALRRDLPALQIMTVVEHKGDGPFLAKLVPMLASRSLDDIAASPLVREPWGMLARKLAALAARIRERASRVGCVVVTDLSDTVSEVVGKYVPYALFPDLPYSVVVSRSRTRIKISVGFNPWSPVPRRHDISAICERHGGGGHPTVGAIAFSLDQLPRAREVAQAIVHELDDG